jgi:hypothetical protein
VPNSAAGFYKAKELLGLSAITVNGAAFTGVSASAVHVNAYLGDVTGNGTIDALDVATANNVAGGSATGFAAYTLLDPAIIGDPQGDVSVDAGDVTALAAFVSHLPTPTIPAIPTGLVITPTGPDPILSLGEPGGVSPRSLRHGGVVNISVQLDDPHPAGSTGMTEAVLALTYDPSVFSIAAADITLGSIPSMGAGWQLNSAVDAASGQIAITLYSTTPITSAQAGSLVNLAFQVMQAPGQNVGLTRSSASTLQLVNTVTVYGQEFTTQVDDAQGQFVLSPGVNQLAARAGAKLVAGKAGRRGR